MWEFYNDDIKRYKIHNCRDMFAKKVAILSFKMHKFNNVSPLWNTSIRYGITSHQVNIYLILIELINKTYNALKWFENVNASDIHEI